MKLKTAYTLIAIQSAVAIAGSLYYSNFGDPWYEFVTGTWLDKSDAFAPCLLCIWARIMMYPILPLSLIALWRKSKEFLYYIVPVSAVGICLEIYHYVLQKVAIPNPFGCTASNPCSALKVDYFGFITIPFLCLTAFVVIFTIGLIALKKNK